METDAPALADPTKSPPRLLQVAVSKNVWTHVASPLLAAVPLPSFSGAFELPSPQSDSSLCNVMDWLAAVVLDMLSVRLTLLIVAPPDMLPAILKERSPRRRPPPGLVPVLPAKKCPPFPLLRKLSVSSYRVLSFLAPTATLISV